MSDMATAYACHVFKHSNTLLEICCEHKPWTAASYTPAMMETGPVPLETVAAVVNGWSIRVREVAGDQAADRSDRTQLATDLGLDPPDETELAELADRLHTVFAQPSVARRLNRLNEVILDLRPIPRVSTTGPRWQVEDPSRMLEAALLMALVEHGRDDPRLQRLGTCKAHDCVDAYVDTSQARTRRYCSVTCQNRARAASYRRRHR